MGALRQEEPVFFQAVSTSPLHKPSDGGRAVASLYKHAL